VEQANQQAEIDAEQFESAELAIYSAVALAEATRSAEVAPYKAV
jgi:hypothetical protein